MQQTLRGTDTALLSCRLIAGSAQTSWPKCSCLLCFKSAMLAFQTQLGHTAHLHGTPHCSVQPCHCCHLGRRRGIDTQAFAQRVRNYLNSVFPSWFCCWYSYSCLQQCFVIISYFQNLFITREARDKKLFFYNH